MGISWGYLEDVLGIFMRISWEYLVDIWGISWRYLEDIFGLFGGYLGGYLVGIWWISWRLPSAIFVISGGSLGNILGMSLGCIGYVWGILHIISDTSSIYMRGLSTEGAKADIKKKKAPDHHPSFNSKISVLFFSLCSNLSI